MAFGKNKLRFIYEYFLTKLYQKNFGEDYVLNINRDLLNPHQKKALVIYITKDFKIDFDSEIYHPNLTHSLQMISVLIKKGYAIDVFHTKGVNSFRYVQKNYDIIIGFGPLYEKVIESGVNGFPILFLTENDPRVVKNKYQERINYYKERHSDNAYTKSRSRESFYSERQLEFSKVCIAMSSSFNIANMHNLFNKVYTINVNGLYNTNFKFDINNAVRNKKNFVWFGSNGCIHKGLDILVDVFSQLPEYTLSIYGLPAYEYSIIKDKITHNIHYCGSINVFSDAFITDVLNKHCFVISASCSEGMNSGVATCMRHGLIPVITKETGFEPHESIIELNDYDVNSIREIIVKICSYDAITIQKMSESVFNYGNDFFGLKYFTSSFDDIITDIETLSL